MTTKTIWCHDGGLHVTDGEWDRAHASGIAYAGVGCVSVLKLRETLGEIPESEAECDFCGSQPVVWDFPAEEHEIVAERIAAGVIHHISRGAWSACAPCTKLVKAGDREELARRAAETYAPSAPHVPMPAMIMAMRETHDNFWSHRLGPGEEATF